MNSIEKNRRATLDELISVEADPIIRKVLLHRLNLYLNSRGRNLGQPEAEDLYQTVILKLVAGLGAENAELLAQDLGQIHSYVATIAHNVCNDFLRMKYPERNRLKIRLRDLMRRYPGFACWIVESQLLCGLHHWTGRVESARAATLIAELNQEEAGESDLNRLSLMKLPLSGLVVELFNRCEGPIEIDRLVQIIIKVQGLEERPEASLDGDDLSEGQLADTRETFCEQVELRELLRRLWAVAFELPLNQRKTFIFTSSDYTGESLLHRILREQIVTITQIYQALEMTREQLISLWDRLPLDASATAAELGTSIHMVAKWRHRALKRLSAECGRCK
ncbi:MAG TPA: hypothetical protein VJ302_23565 [Blastocatellia bacterium]|nr:hypothetical protein [Blastocatellia bacterium]